MTDLRYIGPSWDEPQGGATPCLECDGSKEIDGAPCLHCAGAGNLDEEGNPVFIDDKQKEMAA